MDWLKTDPLVTMYKDGESVGPLVPLSPTCVREVQHLLLPYSVNVPYRLTAENVPTTKAKQNMPATAHPQTFEV